MILLLAGEAIILKCNYDSFTTDLCNNFKSTFKPILQDLVEFDFYDHSEELNFSGIYILYNDTHYYVGQTSRTIEQRFKEHRNNSRKKVK